jgi:hypothetical protein
MKKKSPLFGGLSFILARAASFSAVFTGGLLFGLGGSRATLAPKFRGGRADVFNFCPVVSLSVFVHKNGLTIR